MPNPEKDSRPLVICAFCGTAVDQGSAEKRTVLDLIHGPATVWVCQTCSHLGSEEATKKYVMKEKKTVGR